MLRIESQVPSPSIDSGAARARRALRVAVFLGVLLLVAGGGLVYDYSRPAVYRASARISVEPPAGDATVAKTQFAVLEAQAMMRSDLTNAMIERLKAAGSEAAAGVPEASLKAEAVAQTNTVELHAEGGVPQHLVAMLSAWLDAYIDSRKAADQEDEGENVEDARHAVKVAQKAIEDKRAEMEAFRKRHGIVSIEREENPSASRLKGLFTALNEAAGREVNAEARLKALQESVAQDSTVLRNADKTSLGNLESRANDLRARMKDLEHDYTPQYLTMDPKYKAMKANLARLEQQVEQERQRSHRAALAEVEEQYASAQRAAQRLREQIDSLKQDSQAFSMRFVELKRMGSDLEQLQETRRLAIAKLSKLEQARKPAMVKIRVLTVPTAAPEPIWPNYTRDAAIAMGSGLLLAVIAVWLIDYLRRDPEASDERPIPQPLIQVAYPILSGPGHGSVGSLAFQHPTGLLGPAVTPRGMPELTAEDVAAMWNAASAEVRLILAALFSGIGPDELAQLQWHHVDLAGGSIDIPGASARRLRLLAPLRSELEHLASAFAEKPEAPLVADGNGGALDEAAIDQQLAFAAHDAAIRRPDEITGRALHFTYAAFLARQGIRMTDLAATVGRLTGAIGAELIRLAPPGKPRSERDVELIYPGLRFG